MPPRNAWPGYSDNSVGPSAAMRACTAFWAPLPSATMVITAPTPMMMPSIVRNDRSLLARIAWSATWKISPSSMLRPRRRRLPRRRGGLLLLHARQATNAPHPLLHVALRIDQRRAGQHQHRVLLGQPAKHLDVVEVGQPGADLHRRRLAVLQREHDVTGRLALVAPEALAAAPTAHPLERGRRQLLARHPLLEGRAALRFGDARRQLDRGAVRRRQSVSAPRPSPRPRR